MKSATGDSGAGPQWAGAGAGAGCVETDEVAELKSTLQRVKAEYDNYRKRSVRQEQAAAERGKASCRQLSCCRCSTTSSAPAATATWSPAR